MGWVRLEGVYGDTRDRDVLLTVPSAGVGKCMGGAGRWGKGGRRSSIWACDLDAVEKSEGDFVVVLLIGGRRRH